MRLMLALGLAMAVATPVAAAPEDPVRAFLSAASQNWDPKAGTYEDYFSDERLDTLYSHAFAASFRAAWARASEDDEGIFEMDFVINAQDGCPFEDLKLDAKPGNAGAALVEAHFKAFRCMTNGDDATRVSRVVFKVITENGHDVIDDILRVDNGDEEKSIRREMDAYGR